MTPKFTHIIDRQFGIPLRVWADEKNVIYKVEEWGEYGGKLAIALTGKTIDESKVFLKETFKGIFMNLKPF